MHAPRTTRVAAVLTALLLGACASPTDDVVDQPSVAAVEPDAADERARLSVLEAGVDVAETPDEVATASFRPGDDGESLRLRDAVRTDASGFAEIAWFEGALTRLDSDAILVLTAVDATPGRASVRADLDVGRVWHRLRDGEGTSFEVVTDVGTAAVRGTAFWINCSPDGACTFAVLEGRVVVTTADGATIELGPGDEVTIGGDDRDPAVVPTDPDDEWVLRNAALDAERGFAPLPSSTAVAGEADPVVVAYFEAFGADTVAGRSAMLNSAVPGSGAHDFATYWSEVAGVDPTSFAQVVSFGDGEVEACIPPEERTGIDSGCVTYGEFELDPATGLLVDFSTGAVPISQLVVLGDGRSGQADGVTIELVAAHVAERFDRLTVLFRATNTGIEAVEVQVRLLTASGDIVQHEGFTNRPIPGGGSVVNGVNFPNDVLGGTLQVRLPSTAVVEVPIPSQP